MSWEDGFTKVRLPKDLTERIDALRGMVPRETYVRSMLIVECSRQEDAERMASRRRARKAKR